ncbi:ATP-binding protein [Streptomyces sp. WAC 06738]|uniref:NACHT domain-containing protein n=1 Tax=Streptomyces sp. WAC 06738 TaxID=2203210 RepID=UPI000F6FA169|nr:NACHT domain-containing protein [Streptomyces sp. WAC 06738]AZM50471.1 ATP-binding protein [Streptomyces sp. WAC 06738]
MVAEAAALRLGQTVATAAARVWLGGRRREQERSLELDELLRTRVAGLRPRREIGRQFEKIADAVYDRLEPHLGHAFQQLDEGGRQAVVDAVCTTLTSADLSDEALMGANARSAELIRQITASTRAPVGLNEAETRLYEALFAECVEYYVRIVRSLPPFEERAATELLARTAAIGDGVARILERLPDRSLFAPEGTDQDAGFRRRYLELVSRELDEVELFRQASDRAAAPRIKLSVAYVSLRASGNESEQARAGRSAPMVRSEMSYWEDTGNRRGGIEDTLSGRHRVLLRGEAGSGKTTLLRWLAITAARGAFTGELASWNGLTPIFVKLREYSGRTPPRLEDILDGVAGTITGVMPRGWVERQLEGSRVLLLIDGVDELLEQDRRAIREWLRRLLRTYGGIRVVVTSRPAAAGADWLRREDFTSVHLDRMTPAELADFVRRWHLAVRDLGDDLPCGIDELPHYEMSLLANLQERPHLHQLASTPLLAAMLCAMHLSQGRHLPQDRMELYRHALHTLVHERDVERNVPSAVDATLSLSDKLVILRHLAWKLSDNHRSEIQLERAADYVTATLKSLRHLDGTDGGRLLDQLRLRSGVLRSPAEGRLDFVHRTFQEYLAAEEAAEEDHIGNLVSRAHLDLWRETVVMTAGHANTRQREELLNGILDRADTEPRHTRPLRLLAAACQETTRSMSQELGERVDQAVNTLLPPRRSTDPPALAAVGPALLRRLPRSLEELSTKAAVETVRTVAIIGGAAALELLKGYAQDGRGEVIEQLIRAWDYFEPNAYTEQVLNFLPLPGRYVWVSHSGQLNTVHRLQSLSFLEVRPRTHDLTFLARIPPLRHLVMSHLETRIDLSALRAHPDLEAVHLYGGARLTGVQVLEELPNLKSLTLRCSQAAPLKSSETLSRLDFLGLQGVDESSDLSLLPGLTRLPGLTLHYKDSAAVHPLRELDGLTGLTNLTLVGGDVSAWVAEVQGGPPALKYLQLYQCVFSPDRCALSRFPNLERVKTEGSHHPDGTPVTHLDIPGVQVVI